MLRILFVASLGAVPLLISPFFVHALVDSGAATNAQAAAIPASIVWGQLITSILLPVILREVPRPAFIRACLVVALAVSLVTVRQSEIWMLSALFFMLGVCSGIFMYFGTYYAALAEDRQLAFGIRLALTLIISGFATSVLGVNLVSGSGHIMIGLAVAYTIAFVILPASMQLDRRSEPDQSFATNGLSSKLLLIFLVFVFFMGQFGFYAFQIVVSSIGDFTEAGYVVSIGLPRVVAGVVLFFVFRRYLKNISAALLFALACCEVLAIGVMSQTSYLVLFAIAVCLFEISLNLISSMLQTLVASHVQKLAAKWLTAAILGAVMVGPIFYGFALDAAMPYYAIATTMATCFVPVLLFVYLRKKKPVVAGQSVAN